MFRRIFEPTSVITLIGEHVWPASCDCGTAAGTAGRTKLKESDKARGWMRAETRVGYDYAHAVVDDHTRLAYVELCDDEKAETVTGFVERARAFYESHGITAKRVMTDNAMTYVRNRSLHELLVGRGISHRTTQPYRPCTNGKVERFHQTMARE